MERIGLRYNTPDTLVEMAHYDDDIPHYLYWRDFKSAYYSPLHYADSYEVMLLRGLRGEITIAGNSFHFDGDRLFAVPPNIVHDLRVEKGDGYMYVFHANFQFLRQYINIEKIFSYQGMDISDICYDIPEVEEGWRIFQDIIRHDKNIFMRLQSVLELFAMLSRNLHNHDIPERQRLDTNNHALQRLVDWTNAHISEKIDIETAAEVMHLSRYYFCKWFKRQTNMTYFNYLSTVRVHHACCLLESGVGIEETCIACGLESVSYFTQLFRTKMGCTPGNYIKQCCQKR